MLASGNDAEDAPAWLLTAHGMPRSFSSGGIVPVNLAGTVAIDVDDVGIRIDGVAVFLRGRLDRVAG